MVRKARDYRAEYARRKSQYAYRYGITPRQMRKQIETGLREAFRPAAIRSSKTLAAQRARDAGERPSLKRGNADLTQWPHVKPSTRAKDWEKLFASTESARYTYDKKDPDNAARNRFIREHGKAAYTDAYLNAFVRGDGRYRVSRREGGSDALRYWFVDITETYTAEEYDGRYTDSSAD